MEDTLMRVTTMMAVLVVVIGSGCASILNEVRIANRKQDVILAQRSSPVRLESQDGGQTFLAAVDVMNPALYGGYTASRIAAGLLDAVIVGGGGYLAYQQLDKGDDAPAIGPGSTVYQINSRDNSRVDIVGRDRSIVTQPAAVAP
jgi:hypothetical protein